MNNKIAIYGGAFDPPQLAHETIAREAVYRLGLDKLYIVPSGPHLYKAYKTSLEYRRKIMDILVKSLDNENIELCSAFIDGELENTTLNTDKYFRDKLGFSPYQIFGSDLIDAMWTWDPSGEIAMRLPKIIIKRPGFDIDVKKIANFIEFDPFGDLSISELSSTEVRENIKKRIFLGMNPVLSNFIRDNGLYAL